MKPNAPAAPASKSVKRRILLVDDHPVFRFGLGQVLNAEQDLEVCGEAASAPEALDAVRKLAPDLVLTDVSLDGANGIELIKQIRSENPKVPILVISMHDESLYALRALRAGAQGYLMKREALAGVIPATRAVLAGKIHVSSALNEQILFQLARGIDSTADSPVARLTDRELEILQLVGLGRGTRQIAEELHLSPKTVETHRLHMREKLGLKTSQELVRFAVEWAARGSNS